MVDTNSVGPSAQSSGWRRVTRKNLEFSGRQADLSWFDLEKRTGLYKVFGKESVLKSRYVPLNFPGNLLQDAKAEAWTWCDGYVGPCNISGI